MKSKTNPNEEKTIGTLIEETRRNLEILDSLKNDEHNMQNL